MNCLPIEEMRSKDFQSVTIATPPVSSLCRNQDNARSVNSYILREYWSMIFIVGKSFLIVDIHKS